MMRLVALLLLLNIDATFCKNTANEIVEEPQSIGSNELGRRKTKNHPVLQELDTVLDQWEGSLHRAALAGSTAEAEAETDLEREKGTKKKKKGMKGKKHDDRTPLREEIVQLQSALQGVSQKYGTLLASMDGAKAEFPAMHLTDNQLLEPSTRACVGSLQRLRTSLADDLEHSQRKLRQLELSLERPVIVRPPNLECNLECAHGKRAAFGCSCVCEVFWTGDSCNECAMDCEHGRLDEEKCSCSCEGSWAGPTCGACGLNCKNGGVIDDETCTCECGEKSAWAGNECSTCSLKDSDCGHGKLCPDTCTCDCDGCGGWGGPRCNNCTRTCEHGTLDPESCKCSCEKEWQGPQCENCGLNCRLPDQLNVEECACECELPWKGPECKTCDLTCQNGGVLDAQSCECLCSKPWGGTSCERCDMDCGTHGTLNSDTCTCSCEEDWGGPTCGQCLIMGCEHGCPLDVEQCTCDCDVAVRGWGGKLCQKCEREDSYCSNGGKLDNQSCLCNCGAPWTGPQCQHCSINCENGGFKNLETCKCECPGNFGGDTCSKCHHTCAHGQLDVGSCQCKCEGPWTGESCDVCSLECKRGRLNNDACTCACPFPWSGASCEMCDLKCQHGTLDSASCKCLCDAPWGGHECGVCMRRCAHGTLDKASCSCTCSNPWSGDDCSICDRDCSNHGSVVCPRSCKCGCNAPWSGENCENCAIECSHGTKDTSNGNCKCSCEASWSGPHCKQCSKTAADCKHGTLNMQTCSCICQAPWIGPDTGCNQCSLTDADCAHGSVDTNSCTCNCESGFRGDRCDQPYCKSDDQGRVCGGNGHGCNVHNGVSECKCNADWAGSVCQHKRVMAKCHSVGDPHLKTWDNRYINYYKVGSNLLFSNDELAKGEEVQSASYISSIWGLPTNRGLGMKKGDQSLTLSLDGTTTRGGQGSEVVRHNCQSVTLNQGQTYTVKDGNHVLMSVHKQGHVYTFHGGHSKTKFEAHVRDGHRRRYLDIYGTQWGVRNGQSKGLCGDFDGKNNDFRSYQHHAQPSEGEIQRMDIKKEGANDIFACVPGYTNLPSSGYLEREGEEAEIASLEREAIQETAHKLDCSNKTGAVKSLCMALAETCSTDNIEDSIRNCNSKAVDPEDNSWGQDFYDCLEDSCNSATSAEGAMLERDDDGPKDTAEGTQLHMADEHNQDNVAAMETIELETMGQKQFEEINRAVLQSLVQP